MHRPALAALAAAVLLAETAADLNQKGAEHFRAQRPQEAADSFRRSLELDPRQPLAAKMLGLSLQLTGDQAGALRAFETACTLNQKDAETWFYLGRLYYLQNFFPKALEVLRRSVALDSQDYRPHYYLALTLEAEGEIEPAEREYREALRWNGRRRKPEYGPYHGYGVLLTKLGRLDDAEKQLRQAIELDPSAWQARFELAKLHYRRKQLGPAEAELTAALQSSGVAAEEKPRLYHLLARVYLDLGREQEAERVLTALGQAEK